MVEKNPCLRGEGHLIDFFGCGYDAAERLGLVRDLERIHQPAERLVFVDVRGRERFALPYPALRQRLFGGRHFNVLRGDLESLLYARVQDNMAVHFGTTVEWFQEEPGQIRVVLSDGRTKEVDVLVGADGRHSHVRRLAYRDEGCFERSLGFRIGAFVHDGASESLPSVNDFFTLSVPGRQVAAYPIRDGRIAVTFLHRLACREEEAAEATPLAELRAVYGDLGWIVPELLERYPADGGLCFDTMSQVELPRWRRGRVTLVGDACQSVSLLAGQGASLALAGAYVLAEELDRAAGDVVQAVIHYEGRLRPWVAKRQAVGRRIARWSVPRTSARLAFRDLILRASSGPLMAPIFRGALGTDTLRL